MKIGITERGDAGLDLSWADKLNYVDGAILITKNITDKFIKTVCEKHNAGHKIIIHCTCTGWGGSVIEPNVPEYTTQISQLCKLIQSGFPKSRCVLRIDPIFPTKKGLQHVQKVIETAYTEKLLPEIRVRISILDEYRHVKDRFRQMGYEPIYGNSFYAPKSMFENTARTLAAYQDITYECCAEPMLTNQYPYRFIAHGCISPTDLAILGIPYNAMTVNPQNRNGCLCLSCKTELLNNRHRCPHQCAYCFWKD